MDEHNRRGYPEEENYYSEQGKVKPRKSGPPLLAIFIAITTILLVVVIALSAVIVHLLTASPQSVISATPDTTSTPRSTPTIPLTAAPTSTLIPSTPTTVSTPTPLVTLPCNVNLATWSVPSSWVFHDGSLYNDGTDNTTLTAPCQIGTPNYAVEVKIQATKQEDFMSFGIFLHRAPGQNGWQEYETGVQTNGQCNFGKLAFISDANSDCSTLAKTSFTIDTSIHTYRTEVKDNSIRFFIAGGLVDTATDNRLLTTQGDQAVGIYDNNTQLQVSSFQVMPL